MLKSAIGKEISVEKKFLFSTSFLSAPVSLSGLSLAQFGSGISVVESLRVGYDFSVREHVMVDRHLSVSTLCNSSI